MLIQCDFALCFQSDSKPNCVHSFFKGNSLRPIKCLPQLGSFSVDSVGAIWPGPMGDLLSCQLSSGRSSSVHPQAQLIHAHKYKLGFLDSDPAQAYCMPLDEA